MPSGFTSSDFLRIVRDAAGRWSRVSCSAIRIAVRQDADPAALVADDKIFRVMFRTDAWGRNGKTDAGNRYDPKMMAVTSVFVKNSKFRKTVTIVDADIEINAINFTWSASDMVAGDTQYAPNLKATLLHEFGHVVGLDHPCAETTRERLSDTRGIIKPLCGDPQSRALKQTLMYPDFHRAEPACMNPAKLSEDEKRAVCAIYPRHWVGPYMRR